MSKPEHPWKVDIGAKQFLCLIPHDLTYFSENFVGEPIATPWELPPLRPYRKAKKLPDFVS
jgi:hypothetical protein